METGNYTTADVISESQLSASTGRRLRFPVYAALFLISCATLLFEILLTRIFSITMWYHYAFVAVSIALFGMTIGSLIVFFFPKLFTPERLAKTLGYASLLFGCSCVAAVLLYQVILNAANGASEKTFILVCAYALSAIPFTFSGIIVSAALTKYSLSVGSLYCADLLGAAIAAGGFGALLTLIDGISSVFVIGALGFLGSILFWRQRSPRTVFSIQMRFVLITAFLIFAVIHSALTLRGHPIFSFTIIKGEAQHSTVYEKWNTASRIRIWRPSEKPFLPIMWGSSPQYKPEVLVDQLGLNIDGSAFTALTRYGGDPTQYSYLKHDITNIAHYLRPQSDVFVVGAGGGRDILSALVFNQKSVTAAEINQNIISAVNDKFGDFTGHLNKLPNVRFVHAEARSFISRQHDLYNIIQVSLIDTWAATSAGAFTLSENPLYTVEGWRTFLGRLKTNGILSFTRWYHVADAIDPNNANLSDTNRLIALARQALLDQGVKNPRDHMLLVSVRDVDSVGTPKNLATLLVSKDTFAPEDIAQLQTVSRELGFTIELTPDYTSNEQFAQLASITAAENLISSSKYNIQPPTDDRPFFFYKMRFVDELKGVGKTLTTPTGLFVFVFLLSVVCIFLPIMLFGRRYAKSKSPGQHRWILVLFFSMIGFGYMLVELSQLQRLVVFLGDPARALSVVLFVLLAASGIGSLAAGWVRKRASVLLWVWALALLGVLGLYGAASGSILMNFRDATDTVRIAVAIGILIPPAFFMGFAFPLGMGMLQGDNKTFAPWLWGINGAASVCGSVLAVIIALHMGIGATFWIGTLCYLLAIVVFALLLILRKRMGTAPPSLVV